MAPKRSTPLEEVPPSASSTSEEEESGSSEEEEEEEELEKPGGEAQEEEEEEEEDEEEEDDDEEEDAVASREPEEKTQKPLPSSGSKPTPAKLESESDTESESESDSRKVVVKPNPNVKPISSKPIDPRPKGKAVAVVTGKRSADVDGKDGKEAKRSKANVGEKSSEDVKKQLFQRLWSEEDEVAVLEGLVKKGVDAVKDMASFHEFIRKDLRIDVSHAQLKDKVSRLKKKFDNNRKGKMGEEKTFNKSHDQKIFDLSKRIWGSEVSVSPNGDSAAFKSNGKAKAKAKEKTKAMKEVNAVGSGSNSKVDDLGAKKINYDRSSGMEDYVMRKGAELLQGTKKSEMDEKLRQLHVEELELFLKRNKLVREYTEVVLAAYKTNEDE